MTLAEIIEIQSVAENQIRLVKEIASGERQIFDLEQCQKLQLSGEHCMVAMLTAERCAEQSLFGEHWRAVRSDVFDQYLALSRITHTLERELRGAPGRN